MVPFLGNSTTGSDNCLGFETQVSMIRNWIGMHMAHSITYVYDVTYTRLMFVGVDMVNVGQYTKCMGLKRECSSQAVVFWKTLDAIWVT